MQHRLDAHRDTVHGVFSRDLPPALTIDPGDSVRLRTLDAGWYLAPRVSTVHTEMPPKLEPRVAAWHAGHALTGPIAIRGAEPGMTLAVTIDAAHPGPNGYTGVGGWPCPVNDRLGFADSGTYLLWDLDVEAGTARDQFGHTIRLRPFMGVMGMPPAEPGEHSTVPPRITGGNIDCRELVAGSTLYLPIAVSGGLFSTGDGHGAQGDGEVCVTAIECPMDRVDLTFDLLPELHLTTPRAYTPSGWITFGLHEDLNEAAMVALAAMVDLMIELYDLTRHQAFGLASLVVDLRITQIVNEVRGVHAVLPHGAISGIATRA
jgi:acetamidase/formamidase